jgi:hypothetical protein
MHSLPRQHVSPGVQLYTVNDTPLKDLAGNLSKIRGIGNREVETAGFASLSAKECRKMTANAGLDGPSAHRVRVQDFIKLLDDAKAMRIPNSNTTGHRRSG